MSDEPTERDVEALTRLLQGHQEAFRDRRDPFYCTCDQWAAVVVADGKDGNGVTIEDQHLAHLADVISSWYADRIAEGGAEVTARVEALADDPIKAEARREGAAELVDKVTREWHGGTGHTDANKWVSIATLRAALRGDA